MQDTMTLIYRPRWFQNQKLILGTIATVILWYILMTQAHLTGILALTLSVQLVLFFSLFHRPVLAMGALIVGQLTTSSYMVTLGGTQVSIRLLWTIMALFMVIPVIRSRGAIKLGSQSRRVIFPVIFFFGLAMAANTLSVDSSYTWQYLRTGVTSLAMIFILPAVVNNEKDLKTLAAITLITSLVSSVFAIMQHYSFMGLPAITIYDNSLIRGRTAGLTEGPVHLAYILSAIILPMIALFLLKGVNPRLRKFLPVMVLVVFIALYFTYTRSGLYALAPGMLAMGLIMTGTKKKEFLLVAMVLIIGFFVYIQLSGNRYSQGFGDDRSATGRLALWQASAKIAMDYPLFGIGEGRFEQVSVTYADDIKVDSMPSVVDVLGTEQPHNDFLRVWLSFGTPALLAYLVIFLGIFRNFLKGYRESTTLFIKGLSLGCFAAMVAYIVNAATHNLMDSVPLMWILAGFSIAAVKLSKKSQPMAQNKLKTIN